MSEQVLKSTGVVRQVAILVDEKGAAWLSFATPDGKALTVSARALMVGHNLQERAAFGRWLATEECSAEAAEGP